MPYTPERFDAYHRSFYYIASPLVPRTEFREAAGDASLDFQMPATSRLPIFYKATFYLTPR